MRIFCYVSQYMGFMYFAQNCVVRAWDVFFESFSKLFLLDNIYFYYKLLINNCFFNLNLKDL